MNSKATTTVSQIAKRNIWQRLNEVRKEVAYIKKDADVGFGNQQYKAVTHDAVTVAVRPALIKHGVIVVPSVEKSQTVQNTGLATSKGTPIIRYEATYSIAFVNMDDPQDIVTVRQDAHGLDQGDKAPGKAESMAVKYAMLKLFSLETGEDEESRSEAAAPLVIELRKIINDADAEGAFIFRYTHSIEEWNQIVRILRNESEKKGDFDKHLRELLQTHEETLGAALNAIRDAVKDQDDMGGMTHWNDLTKAEKAFIWRSLSPSEKAQLKVWSKEASDGIQ